MSDEKDILNIYWAPAITARKTDDHKWFNNLGQYAYPNMRTLQSDLMQDKNPHRGPSTYLSCPAATTIFKNTVVMYNAINCEYKYDLSDFDNVRFEPKSNPSLNVSIPRPPARINKPTVEFQLRWLFFAEEPVIMRVTPPMFHPPKYTKYASCVPGQYDIGRWIRPVSFELQMWEDVGEIKFEEGEPLMYATFETDKKIKLQRFMVSDALENHVLDGLVRTFGQNLGLEERYEIFENSSLKDIILKEIRSNLVG